MRRRPNLPFLTLLMIGLGAFALAGCAALKERALSAVPAGDSYPTLSAAFGDATPKGMRYNGPEWWQNYLLLANNGARAEMIYSRAIGFRTAIFFPRDYLKQLTEKWRFVGATPNWGSKHRIDSNTLKMQYIPFTIGAAPRACAAFQALWDITKEPGYPLPGQVVFGYYCAPAGTTLTDEELDRLMRSFRMTAAENPAAPTLPLLDPRSESSAAGVDGAYGRDEFPRLFPIYTASERAQSSG